MPVNRGGKTFLEARKKISRCATWIVMVSDETGIMAAINQDARHVFYPIGSCSARKRNK